MANPYDEQLLLDYIEGDLSPAVRAQVEQMARKDARLGQLLESLIADRKALREMPDPPAPEWLMDEVDRQLERVMLMDAWPSEAKAVVRQRYLLRRLVMIGAVAASVAVIATVVISSMTIGTSPATPSTVTTNNPKSTGTPTVASADHGKGGNATRFNAPSVDVAPVVPPTPPVVETDTPPSVAVGPVVPPVVDVTQPPTGETPAPPAVAEIPKPDGTGVGPNVGATIEPTITDTHARPVSDPTAILKPMDPFAKHILKSPAEEQRETQKMLIMLPARPDLAPRLELHIASKDPAATRKLLENLRAAGSAAYTPEKSGSSAALDKSMPLTYTWHIVPTELTKAMLSVQTAPMHTGTEWRQRNAAAAPVTPTTIAPKIELNATPTPWPTLQPDYLAILQQQIPPAEKPAAAASASVSNAVDIAVVIEPVGVKK